ncbi:MAG: hypothetical protein GY894_00345 [Planctomycetes bacterium]|jgi:hypothetical protein|nr:hypothetical protein [Planctomycetota bacterium]MCP4837797.1 hypothetical protein [Planctomycetota bacterium]
MKWPREFSTIVLVTIVTILIWLLAAAKTRQVEILAGQLEFTVASDAAGDRYQVTPSQIPVTVTLEGPALRVRQARNVLTSASIRIPLPAEHGVQEISQLVTLVQVAQTIAETGVTVVGVEPPTAVVEITEFIRRTAVTRADIQSASTVQDVSVTPKEVSVSAPQDVVHELPETLVVDAVVDPRDVARLEPGVLHTVECALKLPDSLRLPVGVTIDPPTALVSFQLVARQRRADVPRVRIQVISTPQDFAAYAIELSEPMLTDVTIEASPDDISEVQAGRAQVIAVVHLSTNDKERGIESKPISFFAILRSDGTATPITATVNDNAHPEVSLSITSSK